MVSQLAPKSGVAAFVNSRTDCVAVLSRWQACLQNLLSAPARWLVVTTPGSDLDKALRDMPNPVALERQTPEAMSLAHRPWSLSRFIGSVQDILHAQGQPLSAWSVIVDMHWILQSAAATANASVWCEALNRLEGLGVSSVLSLYHRQHMPERVLMAGLHAHPALLAHEGLLNNPHHLPYPLSGSSPDRAKLDHWLARLSPSLMVAATPAAAAMGASSRLRQPSDTEDDDLPSRATAPAERWKIRCFGELKIYRHDGQRIEWSTAGAASRRVRTLFAYLLLCGAKGASTEELCALLWPDASNERLALNRLHHTVNGLRKALAPEAGPLRAKHHPFVGRHHRGYVLHPPANTWVDVEDFEQLCRQGATLLQQGALNEALLCLESALKLYSGDLFADLPKEFTETADADWCLSRRYWFREMYFKVHRDCAQIQREMGRCLEAIQHCQIALQRDQACQLAHCELMRIYARQGRREALERQYRLFKLAAAQAGFTESNDAVHALYVQLMRGLSAGIR